MMRKPSRTGATAVRLPGYDAQAGAIAAIMGWFSLRHLRALYDEFDGDLLMPIILGEIAHHNICQHYSAGRPSGVSISAAQRRGTLEKSLESCNAFSLSCATGIPRETIRRKIAVMQRRGWIKRDAAGGYIVQERASQHFKGQFNQRTLTDLLLTCDDIRALLHLGGKASKENTGA